LFFSKDFCSGEVRAARGISQKGSLLADHGGKRRDALREIHDPTNGLLAMWPQEILGRFSYR
jgi:hypothetical protein